MKVLFLLSIGLDRQTTSGHLISAIIESVCKKGHSVHILQKNTGGELPSIPHELNKYSVTTDSIPFCSAEKSNFIARYIKEIKYNRSCEKKIKDSYDAVFIQSTTICGFVVKMIKKVLPKATITLNVQDIFPYNLMYCGKLKKRSLKFKILASIQRYGYKYSNHIITISEDMRDLLVKDGIPFKKVNVIYNWSYQDCSYENANNGVISEMFDSRLFNVVYAGNIGIMQNVSMLVDAANALKNDQNFHFHIIGDGVNKQSLQKKAKSYGLANISFWPMFSSDLAPSIYSSADVNIIPLAENIYKTAMPSKTATCMACSKPIIFAIGRDSVIGNKIKEQTACLLIDSNDIDGLIYALKTIANDNYSYNTVMFFNKYLQRSINSERYAKIIVSKK